MADPSRRPLKSRNTALAGRVARALARTSVTPNQISAASVLFSALAGAAFWASAEATGAVRILCLVAGALGIQLRLLCNLFDGMVAIEGGKQSPTGAFWNEAPDRPADILILAGMGLGAGAIALGWAAAALAVLTAYIRELGTSVGCGPDFSGPMAKQHRMAAATIAAVGGVLVAVPGLKLDTLEIGLWVIVAGSAATALRRSLRLVSSLRKGPARSGTSHRSP
ncbi:MAG: CDP-alcohol phosphatidyltransferase family protein [Rhodobacteraceae bacterium]|nr:CDP-alcohol phosphatidyltransferase family protein [Paracoccaceae bacterium]